MTSFLFCLRWLLLLGVLFPRSSGCPHTLFGDWSGADPWTARFEVGAGAPRVAGGRVFLGNVLVLGVLALARF